MAQLFKLALYISSPHPHPHQMFSLGVGAEVGILGNEDLEERRSETFYSLFSGGVIF